MSWKSEIANSKGCWIKNRVRFDDRAEAIAYAAEVKNRCKQVTDTRIVACEELGNYRYINGELLLKVELRATPLPTEESHS